MGSGGSGGEFPVPAVTASEYMSADYRNPNYNTIRMGNNNEFFIVDPKNNIVKSSKGKNLTFSSVADAANYLQSSGGEPQPFNLGGFFVDFKGDSIFIPDDVRVVRGGDGFVLQNNQGWRLVPTSFDNEEAVQNFLNRGFNDFQSKTYQTGKLGSTGLEQNRWANSPIWNANPSWGLPNTSVKASAGLTATTGTGLTAGGGTTGTGLTAGGGTTGTGLTAGGGTTGTTTTTGGGLLPGAVVDEGSIGPDGKVRLGTGTTTTTGGGAGPYYDDVIGTDDGFSIPTDPKRILDMAAWEEYKSFQGTPDDMFGVKKFAGRTFTDPATGTTYTSDGTKWTVRDPVLGTTGGGSLSNRTPDEARQTDSRDVFGPGAGGIGAAVIVYGPDGTAYPSPQAAINAGVTDYTLTPPAADVAAAAEADRLKKVAELEAKLKAAEDQYSTLSKTYGETQGSYEDLTRRFEDLYGQFDTLTGSYADQKSAYDTLFGGYKMLEEQLADQRTAYEKNLEEAARRRRIELANMMPMPSRPSYTAAPAMSGYTAVGGQPQTPTLSPGSYSAPPIDFLAGLPSYLQMAPDLRMPDFTGQYAINPLPGTSPVQPGPTVDVAAPFQPYLQAIYNQYGVNIPSGMTGIMGARR